MLPDTSKNVKPPWEYTKEEFNNKGHKSFVTGQGSIYVYNNGQSIRIKKPHMLHSPEDVGLKKGSTYTFFIDPDSAKQLGYFGQLETHGKRFLVNPKEKAIYATFLHPKLKTRVVFHKVGYKDEPEVDKHPIEFFETSSQGSKDIPWFRGWHIGNKIDNVIDNGHEHVVKEALKKGYKVPDHIKKEYSI